MNSLANLNAVVDVQAESSTWPSDQGWDPPVATICTGSLPDNRLHFHHSAAPRQEWDWSDSHMLLASQYAGDEHENIDCKPSILQVEALGSAGAGGGSGCGLRQYSAGIISTASMSPSIGGGAAQTSWPGLLNAVPLRQHSMGQLETSTGSCYSSSSLMYGGGRAGLGGSGSGPTGLGSYYTHHSPLLGLTSDMDHQRKIHDILKRGMYSASADGGSPDFLSGRLGLNLGGRTYFSASDNNMLARLHVTGKRFRPNSPSMHVPLCQAEGCKADLSIAKHYHRRHKVCEYHSKAATVIITGNTQRFCQQCSRFHALTEFDEGKRSCRKRLADHNRRRRKPQPVPAAASLPAPNSDTPSNPLQPTSSTDNAASNQNEDQEKQAGAGRSQSDQPGTQQVSKEDAAASTSSGELIPKPSILSPMTLAPSIALTLQNGSRENQSNPSGMQVSSEVNNIKEKNGTAYENQATPFLLNGPSLSLSSNIAAATGAQIAGDSVATSTHPSPVHAPHSFNEVELSVPWLRAHSGSSSRINLMQKSLAKLSTTSHQVVDEGSMVYNTTDSCSRHGNEPFINEHGRMFAEHMHNLQLQAGSVAACNDHHHHHHHQGGKTEDWMLENAVAQEGQIVLSLLETAGSKKEQIYNNHQSAFDAHQQAHERHPLGFNLQHHHAGGLHLNSASPSDVDHEASDAALSLHCMQVLRPLNESLYTTADFMKDGFV